MSDSYPVSERTRLRRRPQRGTYDRAAVHAILDEGFVCHLGFVDDGHVYVVPTGYVRIDDHVYVHAASAGRIAQSLSAGLDVCLTVTLIDGLVLARSAFHHSMNYRSVVAFGRARVVDDPAEKINALRHFTNHIAPGRWNEVRQPTEAELNATTVIALRLENVSAKIRTGPPIDDDADLALQVWAGVIPLNLTRGEGIADEAAGLTPLAP
jgi:uncharacterized protein